MSPFSPSVGSPGFDGLVAGAAGAASAWRAPTVLYLGDVSFLHDTSGLATANDLGAPLAIVVANNGGGRIFEQLPVASSELLAPHLDRFTTPHAVDFEHVARFFGHGFARVDCPDALRDAIRAATARDTCTVIDARIAPHAAARERCSLASRLEGALGREAPEVDR